MRPLWYRLKNKDGKKRKLDGKLKVKFSIMIAQAMFWFFKVILPIVVLVSLSFITFSWVEDVFQSKNNPEYLYQVIGKEDLNELISVAGDEDSGYYLAYKEGFEEKIDDVVKRYKRIGYSYITKDILINMIKAELITQYPDLGGEIGHESDVKIGATYGGGVMNIPLIYQKRASTCGPTVLAMIISYLTNTEVTEDDVYNWCKDDSRYFNGIGSNKEIFAAAAEKWGVGPVTETKSVADVRQALLSGKPVVAYVHAGEKKEFTNGSHFIVLTGIDENGKVHVNSSSSDKPTVGKAYDLEADIDSVADSNCPYFIFEYGASVSTSSGTLFWPSDSTRITSKFGPRNSPTAGASSNHGGVDIGADYGTNVYACSSGRVTLAQDYGSAGNCVIIDHGDGYFSKYMHNSELKVSAGDQVQKGQVIALVGSTGVSTGPHLHFQIEKGGTPVDPMSFKYENGVGEGTDQSFGGTSITNLDGFLFLGDTITEGLKNSKVADDNVTFKTKKDEGSKYWLDNFDSLPEKNGIKGVNVLLGTSDYKDGIDNIKKLIDKLHEKYPDVTIYVDKLLSDSSSDVDSTKREKYISDLKSYCEGKSYIKYIDPTSGVKIKSGECYPASEDDYKTLWKNIKKAILNTGNTSSEEYVPPLIVGNDTGEGVEGFQGAIRIRRVTPNKAMGAILNTGTGDVVSTGTGTSEVVVPTKDGLGKKEDVPEDIKKKMEGVSMRNLSGTKYDDLSYLTIPYYDFNGKVQQGHMVVNKKVADEVLLIFQELYKIKYPIERMEIVDNFSGSSGLVGDKLDYASIEANNTSAFNDRKVITPDGSGSGFSVHSKGQAIDINPKINPYIRSDKTSAHSNAKKYNTNRDTKEGWTDVEKAACITKDSEIYKIFTKYGWTWLGKDDNTGDTQHFEKSDTSSVKTIDYDALENGGTTENSNENNTSSSNSTNDTDSELSNEVKNYISNNATSGTWSVYAKNLKTNTVKVNINNQKMQSASLIKLFIMATAYQQMSEGVTINNAEALIEKMITVSDNDSTNTLIDKLGMDTINQYIKSNGYSNTEIHRKMLASTANGDNYTSVADAAKILERIYNGKCVNEEASKKMLNYLKAQQRTEKIPKGVPSGVVTANKTGELSDVENDAAIIYKDNAPYILVVMSSGLSDTAKARDNIVKISSIVYEKMDSSRKKHVIAVVAGHGNSEGAKKDWYTTGTEDTTGVTNPAWQEKDITLKVANYVKEICKEKYPHLTIVTDGYSKDNEERLKIAKNAGAEMFIGVHFNSSSDSSVQGTGVYYQKGTNYESETKKLAEKLQKTIMDKMGTKEAEGVKAGDYEAFKDGIQNDFGGPALYVEGAFMSNKNDMEIISKDNDEGLKNYAEGIVAGILEYYGEEEGESTYSDENVASSVNSKIYDLKYIPENEFNKKINQQDPSVLNYYTLDGNWKLVVASWSYSTDNGIKFTKNTAINYKSVLKKYITPIEYLMDYYINIKEEDFINDFMDLIYDSEFIIAVQDNVTTTETTTETTVTYDDGTSGESSSYVKINETVKTGVEVTYVDTWFVKFAKQTSYSAASIKSSGGSLTGSAGDLVGEYKTTSYCYICNDDGSGNFGTNVTASGAPATPHRTVAIHNASTGGDPNGLKLGDQIMIEGDPTVYVIEDTGSGQDGAWIDVYVEATGSSRRDCCISSEYADRTVKVYYANGVKEASEDDSNVDDKHKFINTIANVSGKVSDSYSTSSFSEAGPIKTVYDKVNEAYINIGSTRTINITTHTISVQYDNGDAEVSSNEEKFLKLFEDNPKALNRIKGKWLITVISRDDRTSPFLDLTKYLLYKLLGKSYGVTEFDFSIYEPESFTSMKSSSGGREQFVRWLHEWEGINGSISADGKKYIIGDDGFGHPTVGYGIDIFNGGFAERFRAAGYSTDVGAEVDKEFVDNLEKEEIDKAIETVEAKCAGLNLTQYQKYALVSRIFNCGESGAFRERNGKDFVAAYTAYWNADTDDEYKVPANESMFSHKLYTTYMYAPNTSNGGYVEGLNKRRRAEWLLFKTGYYDRINEYYEEGGDIVNVADEVHKYIEQNGYYYSLGDDLPGNINSVKNTKAVCCATFVSWTLYEAGYDWMEECTGINYCGTLLPFLESHGGQKIAYTSMSDLQPGDILFYGSGGTAHTDIYAGDGMWYNCGGNSSVKGSSPYAKGVRSDVYCIIRFN